MTSMNPSLTPPLIEDILTKGTFFYPALKHYADNPDIRTVACDHCYQNNLQTSIGYLAYDLCLPCVEKLTKYTHRNNNSSTNGKRQRYGNHTDSANHPVPFPMIAPPDPAPFVATRMAQDMFREKNRNTYPPLPPSIPSGTSSSTATTTTTVTTHPPLPPIETILHSSSSSSNSSQYDNFLRQFIEAAKTADTLSSSSSSSSSSFGTAPTSSTDNQQQQIFVRCPTKMRQNMFKSTNSISIATSRMLQNMFNNRHSIGPSSTNGPQQLSVQAGNTKEDGNRKKKKTMKDPKDDDNGQ